MTRRTLAARSAAPSRPVEGARLRAEQVTVTFGGLTAVDQVDLHVGPGELVSLIGSNGAGKTSFFNAVSGLVPSRGRILLDGEDVGRLGTAARSRRGIVRTFQRMELLDDLSVVENLLVTRELRRPLRLGRGFLEGVDVDEGDLADAEEVLAVTGLLDVADELAGDLSTGLRRLTELARVLMVDARLILLDEPSSGLDHVETQRFKQVVRQLVDHDPSLAVLLVEHDMSVALDIADYVYVLDFGQLIAEGTPAAIRADERVRAAYLGKEAL